MEPEDLPWPGELEEEEEEKDEEEEEEVEEEEKKKAEAEEMETNLDEVEVVMVEDVEDDDARELDADLTYESQPLESTDDEEDEEARAWLQAHPSGTFPPPPLPKHRYTDSRRMGSEKVLLTGHVWQKSLYHDNSRTQVSDTNVVSLEDTAQLDSGDDQRTESWHFLPQEIDSSHTLDTTQTRFNLRKEGTEVTDSPSVEEGILTQSENQVKEPNRDLLCSTLLVIQDSFASPDLPLLTCLTQDQEFGHDSLFHESELDFAPLRGIPGKSEDTEWFSRPSEVSEALFQAASEIASDLGNSHFSVSQQPLIGSSAVESQGSFLPPEQGTKEETISSDTIDELKTPKDSDSYALCSCMSWKTQEVTQEPETDLADKDQVSFSPSSDTSDEYVTPKESDTFVAACSYVQYWKQEFLQQSENYLTSEDHDPCSDSSDAIDKNKIPEGSDHFSAPISCMPWSKQRVSYHPETCLIEKVESSDIIYPLKVSTSDFLQDLKQQTFEEVADSSDYILEGLQGKAESDIFTLGDDTECCSLDENAVMCSKRVAELQREVCDQGDLTDECIELAGFKNLLDDLDICDSSLQWQSDCHLPSKEESSFEDPVVHSNMDINQSFSSALPPFVPHEPTREFEYHSSDLRMLRVSSEIMPETFMHLPAWNLKFNMARDCGYSISELNEDDRRKVEEIKAKLFGHERTTDLSKDLQSSRGIGYKPEAVCSHIIIESHEKGCFRTLTAEQPQLDSHPCVFRSAEPLEMIRGRRSPSSWRTRHFNLSNSLDQSKPHFKVWNSLRLQSHSPFQNFTADDFKISKGFQMPFREKMDPWLSELEPACMPPEEMDCHSSSQMLPPESMKKFTTSITFSSHRHSKCFSDSSVLKVGVTEGSQCTGASVGVFNSHFTEEQNLPRDLKQETSSPSSFKIISHSPDNAVTILAESSRQGQKLSVEQSHQEEQLLERPGNHSEPSPSTNINKFKEVHFSDNHTLISMGRPSSTLGVKEKNVTVTPDLPSHIFLDQRELFEQCRAPYADHYVRKHHSPTPQNQDFVAPNLPCRIFLETRELYEQSKAPHVDHQMRESHSPLPLGQDHIALDLPSAIFFEQRQLFEQSKAPGVDHHMQKQYFPLPQDQDYVVESKEQHQPKSYISNINVETKFNNEVSQSAPSQSTLITSPSTPPSNRKALSCVRITLSPKTPSKLDSGTLDKNLITLDPASKTKTNSEFDFDLQSIFSRPLEPTSKLLTSKPIDQESLDFLGSKSPADLQVVQSPLPDSNIQDLKTIPFQNSQIVTSKQTQVNFSDLEGYSRPEGTPVSADRSLEKIKPSFSASSGKLSSDAVTQITTESPEKTMFSSEIFINAEDRGRVIPGPSTQKLGKVPVEFASSSSVQEITVPHGTEEAQPSLLPYKPPGSTKMYYVPQLGQIPSFMSGDSKSDTTIESSHSGSNDAIAPDFPAQVLGTRDDDLAHTVNIKHKEGIYSKRAVTKTSSPMGKKLFQKDAQVQVLITEDENLSEKKQKTEVYSRTAKTKPPQPEEKESLQKDTAGSSHAAITKHSAQQDRKIESPSVIKAIKRKEEIHSKRTVPKEAWSEEKESLQIDIEESSCHSEFENTTHSVFKSAKFYFHHPVHLSNDQDFCHESIGRSVFMRHSWKDFFQRHPDKQREHICLPLPCQNEEKMKTDYTRVESLSINVNLENKEVIHPTKSQARNYAKCDKQINDQKKDHKVTPESTIQHTANLNELWNKYQERQKQQKCPGSSDRKELSLVERLDRLAKLLQNPITHSLLPSESTQDDSRGERDAKESCGRHEQQKNKLQKKKRYKSLEKCHKNIGDLKKTKILSTQQAGRSDQIKIEQVKFDKYILRKQPDFRYINNTSSDSRPSEDSELLTDTATNILSTTTSPMESDIFTQTDKEVTLQERSSSISTIDTARLIQAFGHERVCLSPRQIKLYSSITDHQRRYIEKRNKNKKKALTTGYPQMSSEHTRRKHIQVAKHMISSDSSSTSSFWSSNSTFCNKQNVHTLNKGVQAGNLELVNGVKKNTRDVGMTFPTPSSSEVRVEEDSDVTSWSEEKIEEKRPLTSCLVDRKLRKNKQSCSEGVSWFVPVENVRTGPKKENLPAFHGPGISWFAPITNTKPWREPLREQNWQGQHMDCSWSLAGPGRGSLKPFVRASLQESLQLHRPDFISRSGERIKRLKLIVQERKLQNMLQSEREALFNTVREWQGYQDPICPLLKRGFLAAQKDRLIGKKEMIQRSKRIYEQLPEIRKKREEEKRRLEYRSYRLRAQLYKKKVTNQLLGRKVPWD